MRRAPRNSLIALLVLIPAFARAEPPAKSAPTPQNVQAAEHARATDLATQKAASDRATAAAAEEQRLADQRVAAAESLQQIETATADAAAKMDALAARRRLAEDRLAKRAEAMQPLLPLIQRLSLYPAETLLAVPASPEDKLRGALVLQGLVRQLEAEAKALRQDQADLDAATEAVAAETPKLAAAMAEQTAQAAELDRLIGAAQAQRHQAETDAEAAANRAASEAARAATLRAALAALEVERRAEAARAHKEELRAEREKNTAGAEAARNREAAVAHPTGAGTLAATASPQAQLMTPVAGTVLHAFGSPSEAGSTTGISYQAPPNARVVSPCGGRVAFADRFRTYGLLIIIDCGGGYHAVLAGLDRLDTRNGRSVQEGEPVGVMPNWVPGSTAQRPSLYLELRRGGQPVNPAPWLKAIG